MSDVINIYVLAKELDLSPATVMLRIDEKEILIENNCIPLKIANEIIFISQNYTYIRDIIRTLFADIRGKDFILSSESAVDKLILFAGGSNYWGAQYVNRPIHRKDGIRGTTKDNIFILNSDIPIICDGLREQVIFYSETPSNKLDYLIAESNINNFPDTVEMLNAYRRISTKKILSLAEVVNFMRQTLQYELKDYTDKDLSDYVSKAEENLTGPGTDTIIDFITFAQSQKKLKCKIRFKYNKHLKESKQSNVLPYELDTYFSMAYMTLNEKYWEENNMVEKAVSNELSAKIWLYHIMMFICAWRSADILTKLPRIIVEEDAAELLKKIHMKEITTEKYVEIAEQIYFRFRYGGIQKPSKTENLEGSPPLKLTVPESIKPILGMVALICECHNRIMHKECSLCDMHMFNPKPAIKLFGEPYLKLLGGGTFLNRRANKNFMNLVTEKSDKTGVDGYWLASFARSHTGGIDTIPEVTSRYLKAKMDGYTPDEIVKCLMERGVCSFVPYMFCMALKGPEFEMKRITEQTNDMKEIPFTPAQIESILGSDLELATKCKKDVESIVRLTREQNIPVLAQRILKSIIEGDCFGKTEGAYCLAKASYMGCVKMQRDSCIGCEYEMRIKSLMIELSIEIKQMEMKIEKAKTEGEKAKWSNLLESTLYPVTCEMIKNLKYIYGVDVSDYLAVLKRGGAYAVIDN